MLASALIIKKKMIVLLSTSFLQAERDFKLRAKRELISLTLTPRWAVLRQKTITITCSMQLKLPQVAPRQERTTISISKPSWRTSLPKEVQSPTTFMSVVTLCPPAIETLRERWLTQSNRRASILASLTRWWKRNLKNFAQEKRLKINLEGGSNRRT